MYHRRSTETAGRRYAGMATVNRRKHSLTGWAAAGALARRPSLRANWPGAIRGHGSPEPACSTR
jgi:hypothetical protein